MTPSGPRRLRNDARSIFFADATFASAFVARWVRRERVATVSRADEPEPRIGATLHGTPRAR